MEDAQAELAAQPSQAAPTGAENAEALPTTKEGLLAAMSQPPVQVESAEAEEQETNESPESFEEASPDAAAETEESTEETGEEEQETATHDTHPKSKNFRGRWDHLDEGERRVIELTTKRGLSLTEAQRAVYGDQKQASQPAHEAVDATAQYDTEITTTEGRIEDIERQIEEADFDPDTKRKLNKQLRDETTKLAELRVEKKFALQKQEESVRSREQQSRDRFSSVVDGSIEAAESEFPDLLLEDSELRTAVSEEIAYLEAAKSPLLQDPEYPLMIARRMARALGIQKPAPQAERQAAAAPKPTAEKPKPTAQPARGVRPVSSGGSPVEPATQTLEQLAANARSPGAMLELMKEYGTPIADLMRRQ